MYEYNVHSILFFLLLLYSFLLLLFFFFFFSSSFFLFSSFSLIIFFSSPLFISSSFSYVLSGLSPSGCSPSPSPPPRDNFDMRGSRYIYPLSTVITYTTAAPPWPSRSSKTLEATQIYQVKRALSSRPPQTLEALCRGDPKP